jgi:hypothetical protein
MEQICWLLLDLRDAAVNGMMEQAASMNATARSPQGVAMLGVNAALMSTSGAFTGPFEEVGLSETVATTEASVEMEAGAAAVYAKMGTWVDESTAGRSPAAMAYEAQITGNVGKAFLVNDVNFDGVGAGGLLEAKGPTYEHLLSQSIHKSVEQKLLNQAVDQLGAAKGAPITWHFAERGAADAVRRLFKTQGIKGIKVVYTPPK